MDKIGVGVIGTGNIAGPYVDDLLTYSDVQVCGVSDLDHARAEGFAKERGVQAYASTEALLDDPNVQIAVNLTPHSTHKTITEQALQAGKHVYSEKPLALSTEDALALVELAREKGLRLACSPFTTGGEAQQTLWKLVRDGKLGHVRVIYGEVNWGRIETWHPAPIPFYQVGPLFDVGVYVLAIVTSMFGPVRSVFSRGKIIHPERVTKDGKPYQLESPDWIVSLLELDNGIQLRLTTDFYVANQTTRQTGIEIHGDAGSAHLESFLAFHSALTFAPFGEQLSPVELLRPPFEGIPWGHGIHELVQAIQEDRPHRYSGEQAAHITEILSAANQSMQSGQMVAVTSTFVPPEPATWAV